MEMEFERKVEVLLMVVLLIVCNGVNVKSDSSSHRYNAGDQVPLYANKFGSFHNPSETYSRYFDLPFCLPAHMKEKKEALGEVLNGDRLVSAPYELDFLKDKDSDVICRTKLTKGVAKFRDALKKDYYFQMYYDDLPVWGFIGKVGKEDKTDPTGYKYYIFRHLHFEVLHNDGRIIEIDARTDPTALVDVTDDKEVDVEFMYTVKWKETKIPFEKRMDKYSKTSSLPHHLEIHWFSIINSCVTVLLLTGFLATILMPLTRNQLKTRKRLDGNTFMEMFLGIQDTNLFWQQQLALERSYLFLRVSSLY